MNNDASTRTITPRARTLLALTTLAALVVGLGLTAAPVIADEQAHARALVERGGHSLATGDRAAGVLDIERARWLAPRAGFVRSAVRAAAIRDPEPAVTSALRMVTSREWGALATALGWSAGLMVALAVVLERSRRAWKVALAAAAAFLAAMLGVAQSSPTATAVVTAPAAQALVAPYAGAAPSGPLPAGTLVVRSSVHGDFVRVRSGDGLEGWTSASALEPVARPAS